MLTKNIPCNIHLFLCLVISLFFWRSNASQAIQKKAIVIGATCGIGEALVRELCFRNYSVGFTGRRYNRLAAIQNEIPAKTYIHEMDVTRDNAQEILKTMIEQMGGVDIIIINAGIANYSLEWEHQKEIIEVNVKGFVAMASEATDYFMKKGSGHIVGISSIAALRGSMIAPVYSASKAFVSNYLQGLRARLRKMEKNIDITVIEPGLIDTAMTSNVDLWKSTTKETAFQICSAIEKKREHAYVTREWRLVAWLFKILPDFLFYKLSAMDD